MSEQAAAPAGWYPDSTQGQERYWDGSAWTDQLRPAAPAAPSAPAPRTPSAFGGAIRGYWRGTTALLRGDALGAYAATGGSALASWILPIAKHSIVFAFLFLGYLGWLFG
ncbi:MAG: DUF2510 domain-containing protein, partial [Microbacteriaceae bacterium]|nr:DUF2510 domain-containing protein [Microbacteriaceae bacterium]